MARGFWKRTRAMLIKEFIQLRRDRVSFGMIVMLPLMQLILFGYAINTTPRNLPTAVLLQESSDVGRSILAALQNTQYFRVTHQLRDTAEFDRIDRILGARTPNAPAVAALSGRCDGVEKGQFAPI